MEKWNHMEVKEIQSVSKQEMAYDAIKEAIIREELKPNQMLSTRTICARFGISRTPVMEAFKRLSYEGFVETIPDKGVIVTSLCLEDHLEFYQLREGVEGVAARLCAERQPADIIEKMELYLTEIEEAYEKDQYGFAINKDNEFHVLLVNGSGNQKIIANMRPVLEQSKRGTFLAATAPQRIHRSNEQHRVILEAIRTQDPKSAEEAARFHMQDVYLFMKTYMEKYKTGR